MVRTRFAPSPTGHLHIGGVRTALFNWLFARRHGGAFVLRIDDTDLKRNLDAALEPILEGFRWLGLDWDEGPQKGTGEGDDDAYHQSRRQGRYREVAAELVERGHAYRDYARPAELEEERRAAEEEGRRWIYSRRWAAADDLARRRFEDEGRLGVVRLAMPREGACRFEDLVRGPMELDWSAESDHVIQRADGTCLYHLASAVDDHDLGITHVIRAEEHLSNTPRQIFILEAMGWETPEWAHLPYVAEPGSRNKLSKRRLAQYEEDPAFAAMAEHGREIARRAGLDPDADAFNPVLVEFYRAVGYLPQALLNYLLLLGWSLDDSTEMFDRDAMIEHFDLSRVNRSPASFDPAKLDAFQQRYMADLPVERKVALATPFLHRAGWLPQDPSAGELERVRRVVEAAGDRIAVAGDVLQFDEMFVSDAELVWEEKAWAKRIENPEGAVERLARFRDRLAGVEAWDEESLEEEMRAFCDEEGIKLGGIIHAVRVAVTGKAVGFGMFEVLAILGRESCLARIDRALARAGG